MIELDFYGHFNTIQKEYYFPQGRIIEFGGKFHHATIIHTKGEYCLEKQPDGFFRYLDCKTKKPFQLYTYLQYARRVVNGWMNSESHCRAMLNEEYQFLGCAARISRNPYTGKTAPYPSLTQNFSGFKADPAQSIVKKEEMINQNQ